MPIAGIVIGPRVFNWLQMGLDLTSGKRDSDGRFNFLDQIVTGFDRPPPWHQYVHGDKTLLARGPGLQGVKCQFPCEYCDTNEFRTSMTLASSAALRARSIRP